MRFRVRYHRVEDLVRDHDQQLSHGGLLVRVEPPASLQLFDQVELEIVAPRGAITLEAQVVQLFVGVGVALTFALPEALKAAVTNARAVKEQPGPEAEHSLVIDNDTDRSIVAAAPQPSTRMSSRPAPNPVAEKLHAALYGTRDERAAIMRDNNPSLHVQVLRNPGLQADEVVAIAKMRTVSAEVLKQIADRREWSGRAEVALALVRNPKTPVPLAIRMLEHVTPTDLRQLAKDTHTRAPIQQAARKKVLGP